MLTGHVRCNSRFRIGQVSSLLDSVVSKYGKQVNSLIVSVPFRKSGHVSVTFEFCIRWQSLPYKLARNFGIVKMDSLNLGAKSLDWSHPSATIDEAFEPIKRNVHLLTEKHAPLTRRRPQDKSD
ncbi:hypothetical protein AHF37_06406 [Paragonimus kellicotti]|nr:hypothetical protein AHF37_06406 [Paragonimus kellicotti]